jgi:GrpB-like predicted nucleotidyltransferase (UPF0157 family)
LDSGIKLDGPIERISLIYKGEYAINRRHCFSKLESPKVSLHLYAKGHLQIERYLHFVMLMRRRQDLAEELSTLKFELSTMFSKEIHQLNKSPFYVRINSMKRY